MVDTVAFNLSSDQFKIAPSSYTRFSPAVRNFFIPPYADFGSRKMLKADCNPSNADKATGYYFPRLTLFKGVRKGGIAIFLRIECSVPKIPYNNNFDEVEDYEFDYICLQLQRRLQHYGVYVDDIKNIINAEIAAIHYSHNIPLTDYSTPSSIIKEIAKVNISKHKDIAVNTYRNTGEAVRFHTNTWEFIIYDKIKEHNKSRVSEKGRFEKDAYCQLNLFDEQPAKSPFEVIRLEARYGNRIKLKSSLGQAGIDPLLPLTFKALYSQKIAKTMLQYELSKIKDCYPAILLSTADDLQTLYADLTIKNPRATLKSKMEAIAYFALLQETGSRDIRTLGNDKPTDWYKFQQRMNKLDLTKRDTNCFEVLETALAKFRPMKLKYYLNYDKG